ncbi:hypothetical protein MARCHEWKA_01810 [Brevundimonas phage vB_BpoS-Marchewka]|uniref:Uncharacterized protein n=1 Tax=Brevundimonas phage vB_BpoS-Marchewka TaxID=2948604 RepID=A0A9E7N5G2_9CAUD|nr:hypothetical protein MARCHEWKA_01810 [Brevundimonas phage vB_BpoS-Marchewka]UTC29140.1 hypothetical protein BAMBUS_00570 [Brevundimonas phage vB_BpoS-Bambus]
MSETPAEYAFRKEYVRDGYLDLRDGAYSIITDTTAGDRRVPMLTDAAFRSGCAPLYRGERVAFDLQVTEDGTDHAVDVRKLRNNRYRGIVRTHPSGRLYVRRTGPVDGDAWIAEADNRFKPGDIVSFCIRIDAFDNYATAVRPVS